MKVMKFGGTSVGLPQRMHEVAKLITSDSDAKIVVLSAVSGTTNSLVEISSSLSKGNRDEAKQKIDALEAHYKKFVEGLVTTQEAIDKAQEALDSNKQEVKVEEQEFVFVKDNGILKRIAIDDILFLEAMGDYVKVHTLQKFHVVHATLKSIEEKLPSSKFLRVHRSFIVAINKIDYIQEGTISIVKTTIPVADTHKSNLNKRLNLL